MAKILTLNTADIMGASFQFHEYIEPPVQFPEYVDPLNSSGIDIMANIESSPANKLVEQVVRTPGRQPSPQPTHFSVPHRNGNGNGNGHRVLRSATVGYIAPEFKGKQAQMIQGESYFFRAATAWYTRKFLCTRLSTMSNMLPIGA
jgi:glutamate dehydrogenase